MGGSGQNARHTHPALTLLSLTDTTVNPQVSVNIGEIGPAILLAGWVLILYWRDRAYCAVQAARDPSQPGTWSNGPDLPPDTSGKNFNSPNGNIQTAIDAPACCCRAARFCSWADKRCGRLTMARPSSGRIPRPCLSTILRRTASRRSVAAPRMASIHGNRAFFCFRTAKCS